MNDTTLIEDPFGGDLAPWPAPPPLATFPGLMSPAVGLFPIPMPPPKPDPTEEEESA